MKSLKGKSANTCKDCQHSTKSLEFLNFKGEPIMSECIYQEHKTLLNYMSG